MKKYRMIIIAHLLLVTSFLTDLTQCRPHHHMATKNNNRLYSYLTNGNRSVRSTYNKFSQPVESDDLGQQAQGDWDNTDQKIQTGWENLGQQTQNDWENLGQQTQNDWENLGQQTQTDWEDLGQQTQNDWENLGQQTQNDWENLGQQTQNDWENLGQQTQNDWENLGQQTQTDWEDLGQQTQNDWKNLGQQTQTDWDNFEQPTQTVWDNLGQQKQKDLNNLGLQTQSEGHNLEQHTQTNHHWSDLGEQTQFDWKNLGQKTPINWNNLTQTDSDIKKHWTEPNWSQNDRQNKYDSNLEMIGQGKVRTWKLYSQKQLINEKMNDTINHQQTQTDIEQNTQASMDNIDKKNQSMWNLYDKQTQDRNNLEISEPQWDQYEKHKEKNENDNFNKVTNNEHLNKTQHNSSIQSLWDKIYNLENNKNNSRIINTHNNNSKYDVTQDLGKNNLKINENNNKTVNDNHNKYQSSVYPDNQTYLDKDMGHEGYEEIHKKNIGRGDIEDEELGSNIVQQKIISEIEDMNNKNQLPSQSIYSGSIETGVEQNHNKTKEYEIDIQEVEDLKPNNTFNQKSEIDSNLEEFQKSWDSNNLNNGKSESQIIQLRNAQSVDNYDEEDFQQTQTSFNFKPPDKNDNTLIEIFGNNKGKYNEIEPIKSGVKNQDFENNATDTVINAESKTDKPGFWASAAKKYNTAKKKVVSWFSAN